MLLLSSYRCDMSSLNIWKSSRLLKCAAVSKDRTPQCLDLWVEAPSPPKGYNGNWSDVSSTVLYWLQYSRASSEREGQQTLEFY